jgi:hypothetical protein
MSWTEDRACLYLAMALVVQDRIFSVEDCIHVLEEQRAPTVRAWTETASVISGSSSVSSPVPDNADTTPCRSGFLSHRNRRGPLGISLCHYTRALLCRMCFLNSNALMLCFDLLLI